jgi:hypothetical protein
MEAGLVRPRWGRETIWGLSLQRFNPAGVVGYARIHFLILTTYLLHPENCSLILEN